MKYRFWLLVIMILFSSLVSASLQSENWKVPANLREYQVTQVVDGDTIKVETLGKVRYIGMNTPETHHPTKGVEPYGPEACLANRKLVEGKRVRLQMDMQQRDKYGRLLAYVYVGSIFVNAYLVEIGYAQVMTIPPNVKYQELFVKLQREARESNRGLWGLPKGSPKQEGGTVYWASSKSNKYHFPSCKWAKKIDPGNLIKFHSREEAIKVGYLPCGACKP
jgi:micrococcal nuclease